ncbi:unnamed protein product, partial [Scytosiphon promiscuus]
DVASFFQQEKHGTTPMSFAQDFVERHAGVLQGAAVAVADGNLPPAGFARLAELCAQRAIPLVFEPTSVAKCTVPFLAGVSKIPVHVPP